MGSTYECAKSDGGDDDDNKTSSASPSLHLSPQEMKLIHSHVDMVSTLNATCGSGSAAGGASGGGNFQGIPLVGRRYAM